MKKLILFFTVILTCQILAGQMCDNVSVWLSDNIKLGENKLCKERGHIQGDAIATTLAYCPPYYEENDTQTVMVYPACNYIDYTCQRCGESLREKEEERRIVIWEKGKDLTRPELKKETVLSLDTLNVYLTDIDSLNQSLGIRIDTSPLIVTQYKKGIDTIPAVFLISACIECPAYTIKGFYSIDYDINKYESYYRYFDEFKQELPDRIIVWDHKTTINK